MLATDAAETMFIEEIIVSDMSVPDGTERLADVCNIPLDDRFVRYTVRIQ